MDVVAASEPDDSLQATKDQLCNLLQTLRGPFAEDMKTLQMVGNVMYCNGNTTNAEFNQNICTQVARLRGELCIRIQETVSIGSGIIGLILKWRRYQAFIANGAQCPDDLADIKTLIWQLLEASTCLMECVNVLTAMELGDQSDLDTLRTHLQRTRVDVMYSAFIVSEQPIQVMRKSSNFSVEVQWLVGRHVKIGSEHKSPIVTCLILSEEQVREYLANSANYNSHGVLRTPESSGDLGNNTATLEFDNEKGVYLAKFTNVKLNAITRAPRLGDATVVDEKFALLFVTSVDMDGYRISLWTLSLPVVAIVHGNQDRNAWATITWDNVFAEMEREAFKVPDKVSWSQFSAVLNTKFASITGRLLTEDNLSFIYRKLNFRANFDPEYIKWTQFCKMDLPEVNFTFWEWFFGITKLIKEHLFDIWKAGLITGFISKKEAEAMLANMPVGTFLMRFSESSHLAGISISFVERNEVCHVAPWTALDLRFLSFADRIRGMNLMLLYPNNVFKDDAFGQYYSPRPGNRSPYTATTLVPTIVEATMEQPQREGNIPQGINNSPQRLQPIISEDTNNSPMQLQQSNTAPTIFDSMYRSDTMDQHPLSNSVVTSERRVNLQQQYQQTSGHEEINNLSLQQQHQSTMYQDTNNNPLPQEDPPISLPNTSGDQDLSTLLETYSANDLTEQYFWDFANTSHYISEYIEH